jgi:NAD+ kinase
VGESIAPPRGRPWQVVVVRKTTPVEALARRPDAKLQAAIAAHDPIASRVLTAHAEHTRTAQVVEAALQARDVRFQTVARFNRRHAHWADLVITVGGDGTFLRASHCIDASPHTDGPPMLAVNSAVTTSAGYFAAATEANFGEILTGLLSGGTRSRGLWRLQAAVNGVAVRDLALNDILLAHRSPAETTRYVLGVDGRTQEQKSSGLWIATAAGSTAAIRAAGGDRVALDGRRLQFRVRELMTWAVTGEPIIGGHVDRLEVVSRMSRGALFIDGGHQRVPLGFGDRVTLTVAARPMPWVAPQALP